MITSLSFSLNQGRLKSTLPVLFLLLFSGFYVHAQTPVSIKIEPKGVSVQEFEEMAKDIRVLKLEDTRESIVGRVENLLITENRVYILTGKPRARVIAFDRGGKFLFKVLPTGQGPEEVDRIENIAVDGDELMVYGDLSRKVLRFGSDGKFKQAYKLDFFADDFVKTKEG